MVHHIVDYIVVYLYYNSIIVMYILPVFSRTLGSMGFVGGTGSGAQHGRTERPSAGGVMIDSGSIFDINSMHESFFFAIKAIIVIDFS